MKRATPMALFLATVSIATVPVTAVAQPSEAPAAAVRIDEARRDTFAATLWVSGSVVSLNDARIAAETDGRITWVAREGTRITAGDAIARIDAGDLELDLADSRAQLGSLKAQLTFQEGNLSRLQRLAASSNASTNQVEEASSQLDMTHQAIKRAEVNIAQIERRIRQSEVPAPFSGVVAERLVQVGEFVNRGAQVARLVDTENREIRAQAPLSVAGWVREGMELSIQHQGAESLSPISHVIPVGDQRSRMFEVRVAVNNTALIVGSPVRVALPNSEPRELVAIHRDALVLRGNDIFVMRVKEDNTVERVDVSTGIGLDAHVEVLGGLDHGDRVIVRGGERLQPGQSVLIAES
ncbi:efflux RND transporter periplasmic adaptor subunit [Marinihelvus fidelis]|uniref:Efflux RND transporter periplasmic adaptor subunit n=1 Tax=Marinihelvus fidelis TaxID=2613842 RepID=A0A5N0T8M3_9GAMM|nr:efflux RND transporter periplasmic adaptor subunit [Marinihelvus fidelis]KAA9131290.1 efflux RND transporter periplasmic adaptor subunit [Marinihelvus fidelis]